jgi:galacturonosyltransferase
MNKKILFFTNNEMGLYKFRKEVVEELLDQKYKIYLLLPVENKYIMYFRNLGCFIYNISIDKRGKNPINDIILFLSYIRFIRKINPDLILTYTIKPNLYGGIASLICKVPYISNITGIGSIMESNGIIKKIAFSLYSIALKNASFVFFQNLSNSLFFASNNIKLNKSCIIPGSGVNIDEYYLQEYPDEKRIEFVFISRIMKEKGIEYFLKAASCIKKKYKNVVFSIIGYCDEYYENIIDKYTNDNIVKYLGEQSDIRPFLKKSHCIIHPTHYPEGISNILLESAACGRPVIATRIHGCLEVINDGVTGFLFNENDLDDLIEKIQLFLSLKNSIRKEMGIKAREKVCKEFDRNLVVKAYLDVIKKNYNDYI